MKLKRSPVARLLLALIPILLIALVLQPAAAWAEEQTDSTTTEVYLAQGEPAETQSASLPGTGDSMSTAPIVLVCTVAVVAIAAVAITKTRSAKEDGINAGDAR